MGGGLTDGLGPFFYLWCVLFALFSRGGGSLAHGLGFSLH